MKLVFENKKRMKESVDWDYYNSPDILAIEEKYLPDQGEGDTMATQTCTAITKLIYKWYNDGDVYDNVNSYLAGWGNDLSSYANWLYKYVPESRQILKGIFGMSSDDDYDDLLKKLNDNVLNQKMMSKLETKKSVGSIYDCDGPFEWEDKAEDDYQDEDEDDEYYESMKQKRVAGSKKRMNEGVQSKEEFMQISQELAEEIKQYYLQSNSYVSNDLLKLLLRTQSILLTLAKGKDARDIPSDVYII